MTQATHNDNIVLNNINSQVLLTRQVGDNHRFMEAWDVCQDDVKIGYIYQPAKSAVWGWKTLEVSNNGIVGGFYETKWDATDALLRYIASPIAALPTRK